MHSSGDLEQMVERLRHDLTGSRAVTVRDSGHFKYVTELHIRIAWEQGRMWQRLEGDKSCD